MVPPTNSKETELQNLLADERERCQQHKQLYQTLKEEHGKLKDELAFVYHQLKEATSKNEQLQSSKDSIIRKLEEQLKEKQKEISKLSEDVKSFDPKKIRDSVVEEASNHYELKLKELHAEADKTRELYNNLHYENAVLKCRLESCESNYSHSVERLNVQHLTEVEQLKNKIESLENKSCPDDSNAVELKTAKHEILQLDSRLRIVLAECEELRAQNEQLTQQLTSTNRTHSKQIADNISSIRALESEKQRIIMQKEVLEKELSNFQEQRRIMNNELQANRREILSLKSKLEESEHKYRMVTTDLQVETEHLKTEYGSERGQLIDEISNLRNELRDAAVEFDRAKQILISRVQQLQQEEMTARQQLWKKSNDFQQEREKVEKRLLDLKSQKDEIVSQLAQEIEILQQKLHMCSESKLELEKEFVSIKEKLEGATEKTDVGIIETLSKQNMDFEKEVRELKEHISFLKSESNAFIQEKDRFLRDIQSRKKSEYNHDEEREILQMKLNWEEQKFQFHRRLEDLESQLKESKNSAANERKDLELKIQKYAKAVEKLKEKLEFQKFKNEELENQREILEKNVPYEVHIQVKNKLSELQRRLEEYRLVVAAEPYLPTSSRTAALTSDKLLTDIKNLQLRHPVGDSLQEYFGTAKTKVAEKPLQSKRSIHSRRRSVRTKHKDQTSKTISPTISSSSDLDLENL